MGFYVFNWDFENANVDGSNDPGGGGLLGAGYEFSPHWQVGAYVGGGKTSEPFIDYTHTHVSVMVSGVAF